MKSVIFISQVLLLTGLVFAQHKPYNIFNKEAELQRFVEQGGKVEEISPNIYRLTHRTGESRTFNLNPKENIFENNDGVDTTIINIWEIDTTKFAGMFSFWQQVQLSNSFRAPLPIEDLNNNGRLELYGYTDITSANRAGPARIFEQDIDGIFREVIIYDSSTIFVKGIGDINGDGNKEIVLASTDDGGADVFFYPVFKSDSIGTLPTTFDLFFYQDTLQINNMVFGDWDKNGITDCAFTTPSIWDTTMCVIAEYRGSINNFVEIFRFKSIFESDISGFAIDDFDLDSKTELVISSGPGNVFVIENTDKNEYSIVNQFPFPVPNSYMQTATNDIDENGKPEFWIGGQDFEEGITIIQSYESDGDNSYKSIARIELRYLVSFYNYYIQAVDIDDDSKEELIISIGNVILILKFVGSPGNHQYKLWYAKIGEGTQPGAQFNPVSIADLDGDGKKDLLIPMERYTPSTYYAFSYILRRDGTTSIGSINTDNFYYQNFIKSYPVPFNSTSSVRFSIAKEGIAKIKIYNSLGKEIETLLEEQLSPGEYNIQWEARDKYGIPFPSGIYFISLQTDNVFKTTKTIFLK
jgi:hypothetical protein